MSLISMIPHCSFSKPDKIGSNFGVADIRLCRYSLLSDKQSRFLLRRFGSNPGS